MTNDKKWLQKKYQRMVRKQPTQIGYKMTWLENNHNPTSLFTSYQAMM